MAGTTNGGINQKPQQPSNNNYGFVSPTGAASQAIQGWENKVTGETFQAGSGGYTNPDPNWTRVNQQVSSLRASNGPSNRILGADPVRSGNMIANTITGEQTFQPYTGGGQRDIEGSLRGSGQNLQTPRGGMSPFNQMTGYRAPIMGLTDATQGNGLTAKPAYDPMYQGPPQGGPAYPMPMQQPQGFNINQAAAQGLQGAMATTAAETGYKPMQVNPAMVRQRGYNPATMAGVGDITADNVSGRGYDAATMGDVRTVSADNVNAGQLAGSDLSAYTNPYETQVVDQALGDIERQRLMAQNVGSAQAGAANAFGGSRQGIAEAETNRAYMEQAAKTASGLRQAGYMNAQDQSGQDIARRMQASLANQQANMQAGQFNAGTDLSRQQANQSAFNQAGQFGASAFNQGNLANQSANMQAQQASAANALAAQQANQAARNNAGQFGANAFNQAGQMNQSAMMQARLANQNAGLSGSQQRLGAASQLGNLSNLGFGMGQQIQGRMDQQGLAQQALQQQLINAAKNQYGGFTGAPANSLQALLAAVGGAPAQGSVTASNELGLMDYLKMGASAKGLGIF